MRRFHSCVDLGGFIARGFEQQARLPVVELRQQGTAFNFGAFVSVDAGDDAVACGGEARHAAFNIDAAFGEDGVLGGSRCCTFAGLCLRDSTGRNQAGQGADDQGTGRQAACVSESPALHQR